MELAYETQKIVERIWRAASFGNRGSRSNCCEIQKFHVYLLSIKFKIVIDCDSFRLTLNKQSVNPWITDWTMFLQQYDYEVVHRPGKRMGHMNALSRCNNILVLEGNMFEQILSIKQE